MQASPDLAYGQLVAVDRRVEENSTGKKTTLIFEYIDIFSAFPMAVPKAQQGRLRKSTENVNISKHLTESTYF